MKHTDDRLTWTIFGIVLYNMIIDIFGWLGIWYFYLYSTFVIKNVTDERSYPLHTYKINVQKGIHAFLIVVAKPGN